MRGYPIVIPLFICIDQGLIVGIVKILNLIVHRDMSPRLTYEIPCDDVSLSINEDMNMITHAVGIRPDVDGVNKCSFKDIAYIAERTAERVHRTRKAQGTLGSPFLSCGNKAAAARRSRQTAFLSRLASDIGQRTDTILRWQKDRNSSFIGDQLIYNDGKIRVNRTDFFYVYSSVTIRDCVQHIGGDLDRTTRRRRLFFSLSIFKRTSIYPNTFGTKLLENVHSICMNDANGTMTLRLGSYVLLDRDDDVYVKVSDLNRLVPGSRGNTFGIFPMN